MLLQLLVVGCLVGIIICKGNSLETSDEFAVNENNPNIKPPHKGDHLDHGDIMFRENEEEAIFGSTGSLDEVFKREVLKNVNKRWKLPVAYEITSSIGTLEERGIGLAIKEFAAKTCITFRKRTSADTDYISFFKGEGCWSYVGRSGGEQKVSIGDRCHDQTTVVHEIMHALGFYHEQSRPDRDEYVTINLENVKDGQSHNFVKKTTDDVTTLGHDYDYESVMHYSKTAFSKNDEPTIAAKGNADQTLGRGWSDTAGMSIIDARQLKMMYCGGNPVTELPVVTTKTVPTTEVTVETTGTAGTTETAGTMEPALAYTRRRRRRRRRRRDDVSRDQKSRNQIKAKSNDKRNNEISNKIDEATDIIEEIKKAMGEKEEGTAELKEDDWEDKFDEEDEIEFE